jgi:hypothetical protein
MTSFRIRDLCDNCAIEFIFRIDGVASVAQKKCIDCSKVTPLDDSSRLASAKHLFSFASVTDDFELMRRSLMIHPIGPVSELLTTCLNDRAAYCISAIMNSARLNAGKMSYMDQPS